MPDNPIDKNADEMVDGRTDASKEWIILSMSSEFQRFNSDCLSLIEYAHLD